ncbi:MAG: PaaI family thioesterase [Acidobacteria bacterium]|nr:PaaI family thioesterase [Acidobacteriota bacterium]
MTSAQAWPENAHEVVNHTSRNSYLEKLGIVVEEYTPERVVARMPVEGNTQPDGFLHGGATMSLAETLASMGAAAVAGWPERVVMGLQQTCNFLSTATEGSVRGTATPVHAGRTTQVWDVEVVGIESGRRVAAARVTLAVRERRAQGPGASRRRPEGGAR